METKENLESDELGVICEHMTRVGNRQPDIHIMRNGLSKTHFRLSKYYCNTSKCARKCKTTNQWETQINKSICLLYQAIMF